MIGAVLWGIFSLCQQQPAQEPTPPPEQEEEEGGIFGKGVRFIPIPFFSTSRNAGNSYGFLPVFMFEDENKEITRLLVLKYEYFEHSLSNYSVDYFGFPDKHSYWDVFVLKAARDDERYAGEYRNMHLAGSDWAVNAEAVYYVSNSERFFGLGPKSDLDDESNYLLRERRATLSGGYHVFENAVVWFQETIRGYGMSRGALRDLPYSKNFFPTTPGFDEGFVLKEEIRFVFDNRDSAKTPSRGYTATAWLNLRHYWGDEGNGPPTAPIYGGGFDLTGVWSFDEDQMWVLAARMRAEAVKGASGDVPFIEMVSLGGNTLRGYGSDRFIDLNGFVLSTELRVTVWEVKLFGVKGQIQLAPFIDTGKVFLSWSKDFFSGEIATDYQLTYGIAFRGIVPPFIVGRVEFGFGEDGLTAFVGLDYPY